MAKTNTSELLESLAADIGENVYMDIAKWHLYLEDAHLHTVLAEQVYPLLTSRSLSEDRVQEILSGIPVKIGGHRELPLIDFLPMQCQVNLIDILEKYQEDM